MSKDIENNPLSLYFGPTFWFNLITTLTNLKKKKIVKCEQNVSNSIDIHWLLELPDKAAYASADYPFTAKMAKLYPG